MVDVHRLLARARSLVGTNATRLQPAVPLDATSMAERWDREWIPHFRRAPEYFEDFSSLNDDVRRRMARVNAALDDPFDSERGPVVSENPVWAIWAIGCRPREIVDRAVVDLGCGAGGIGRSISYVASRYLGIDYSPLALRVAQLVSPASCEYVVRTDEAALAQRSDAFDTAFSRSVFIHQNFQQGVELAALARALLRSGGVLAADFYRQERDPDGTLRNAGRPAKDALDPDHPSRSFFYTDDEIAELGDEAGLVLVSITEAPERNWRIARFTKP